LWESTLASAEKKKRKNDDKISTAQSTEQKEDKISENADDRDSSEKNKMEIGDKISTAQSSKQKEDKISGNDDRDRKENKGQIFTMQSKKEINDEISNAKSKITKLKSELQTLEGELQKLQNTEKEQVVHGQNVNARQAVERRLRFAAEHRRKLAELKREQNGELAETLSMMESMKENCSQVGQAMIILNMVFQSLGRVKTAFVQVWEYWQHLEQCCLELTRLGTVLETTTNKITGHITKEAAKAEKTNRKQLTVQDILKKKKKFRKLTQAFGESVKLWLATGVLSQQAGGFIEKAADKVNSVMDRLPTHDYGKKLDCF